MSRFFIEIVIFICGASTMILELVGSRVLAPYLGTSLFVWTSLIGVVLGCLSIGYWWGGKLADRKPEPRVFSLIVFSAAVFIGCVSFLNEIVLVIVQTNISDIRTGAVAATLILFGAPSVLLGMAVPYAVRLKITSLEKSGTTAGELYAVSTVGSITGTFLAGFFLISRFSNTVIMLLIALVLTLASLVFYARGAHILKSAMLVLFGLGLFQADTFAQYLKGRDFIDVNTPYNRVWIFDAYHSSNGRPVRVMQVNDENDSMMYLDGDDLANDYTKFYKLAWHFNPAIKRTLLIGGAAYSFPKLYLADHPEAKIDVVEIDPKLTDLAREYFRLGRDPRLRVIHEDARTYLNRAAVKYDAILGDAFRSFSVPYQLTTRESIRKMYDALNDDGVVVLNIISAVEGRKGLFLRAEWATLREIFPQVYLFPVAKPDDGREVQNLMLIALKSPVKPKFYSRDAETDGYLHHIWVGGIAEDMPVLRDDYAPVDQYVSDLLPDFGRPQANPVRRRLESLWNRFRKGDFQWK